MWAGSSENGAQPNRASTECPFVGQVRAESSSNGAQHNGAREYDFDLFTIGAGSGGVRAARWAASNFGALLDSHVENCASLCACEAFSVLFELLTSYCTSARRELHSHTHHTHTVPQAAWSRLRQARDGLLTAYPEVLDPGCAGIKAAICEMPFARKASDVAGGAGGTCVLRGCVPKKLMVYGGEFAQAFKDSVGFG